MHDVDDDVASTVASTVDRSEVVLEANGEQPRLRRMHDVDDDVVFHRRIRHEWIGGDPGGERRAPAHRDGCTTWTTIVASAVVSATDGSEVVLEANGEQP
jgi:hypothetical protein